MVNLVSSATRTVSTGDMVVPVSQIVELLKSKLTQSEIDALLNSLLARLERQVHPGDLITAELMNLVLTKLAALEAVPYGGVIPAVNSKAATTLLQTWEAYSGLTVRQRFLPNGTGNDALKSALAVTTSLQGISILAVAGAGIARSTDKGSLMDIFKHLYHIQSNLATLFNSSMPGFSDPGARLLFAQRLHAMLETDESTTGKPSLHKAVEQENIDASIDAQNRINGIVMVETGEVVVGSLDVAYRGSTRGETLVLNDSQPFGFVFRAINKTNRRLDAVQLAAEFLPPRQGWSASASIVGGASRTFNLKPFDPANPSDPAAFQDVQVNVSTPPGTAKNQTGTLRFRAFMPPPINVGDLDEIALTIGDVAVPPQPATVKFTPATPVIDEGTPDNAPINEAVMLIFEFRFTTTEPTLTRDFRFKASATNPANEVTLFDISFDDPKIDTTASDGQNKVSEKFTLNDNKSKKIFAQIVPEPGSQGLTLDLTFAVEAVADPSIKDTKKRPIKVKS